MVRCPGAWKNFKELEENLSLPELEQILASAQDIEYQNRKFAAALKGVDLDENASNARFDEIKAKTDAQLAGMTQDEFEYFDLGIDVEVIQDQENLKNNR